MMHSDLAFASTIFGSPIPSVSGEAWTRFTSSIVVCRTGRRDRSSGTSRRVFLNRIAGSVSGACLITAFPHPPVGPAIAGVVGEGASVYDIEVLKDKKLISLSYLKGKVTLFVNVASYCAVSICSLSCESIPRHASSSQHRHGRTNYPRAGEELTQCFGTSR